MITLRDQDTAMINDYKGFICHSTFDEKDKIFHGRVANTHSFIEFKGKSIRELTEAFHKAIDEHLEWLQKHNKRTR